MSKLIEVYLTRSAGWFGGAVAAGLLLFATPRLNKLGDRVAGAAVPGPGPDPSAEYVAFRKLEVYKAAVESALETAPIDERQRTVLTKLRAKLGLSPEVCRAIEDDVQAQTVVPWTALAMQGTG